jgi:hypothetical protein
MAAVPKLMDPAAFAKAITNYHVVLPLIGQNYVNLTALFLPALEGIAGMAILSNRTKRAAAWIMSALMILFILMVFQAVLRGLNIDCGCFGSSEAAASKATKVGWFKLLENSGMLAMALFVYYRATPRPKYKM